MPTAKTKTLVRVLSLLKLIPVYPKWVSSKDIHSRLSAAGMKVSRRTIERDLMEMSGIFDLTFGESPEGYKWSFAFNSPHLFIPSISPDEALSLQLVNKYLSQYLPPASFGQLKLLFNKSEEVLANAPSLASWPQLVASMPQSMGFTLTSVDKELSDLIYTALIEHRYLSIQYKDNETAFKILPLGVIVRDGKLVLVCQYDGFDNYRNLLIHRIKSVKVLEDAKTILKKLAFDLDDYIEQQAASVLLSEGKIHLVLEVKGYVRTLLSESMLNTSQQHTILNDTWMKVEIDVPHNLELENWLQSQIEHINIISPLVVRQNVVDKLQAGLANNHY